MRFVVRSLTPAAVVILLSSTAVAGDSSLLEPIHEPSRIFRPEDVKQRLKAAAPAGGLSGIMQRLLTNDGEQPSAPSPPDLSKLSPETVALLAEMAKKMFPDGKPPFDASKTDAATARRIAEKLAEDPETMKRLQSDPKLRERL
ncbi:MAG: hypothetical protein ACRDD1_04350, partial [Planctomycetia bacterium]